MKVCSVDKPTHHDKQGPLAGGNQVVVQHTYSPGSAGRGARVDQVGQHCGKGVSLLPAVLLMVSMRLLCQTKSGVLG